MLTTTDLARTVGAVEVLLSPLSYPDLVSWQRDVMRHLKSLAGAELSTFIFPGVGEVPLLSEDAAVPTGEYFDIADGAYRGFRIPERLGRGQVTTMTAALGEERVHYCRTPFYQEFLRPNRCFESVTLAVSSNGANHLDAMPHLHLNKSRPEERFSEKEVALLRVLYPAFRAGIETAQRARARREDLLRLLDTLEDAALLMSPEGSLHGGGGGGEGLLHVNRTLAQLGATDPEAETVETAMMRLGHRLLLPGFSHKGISRGRAASLLQTPAEQEVTTATACYSLRASLLSEELMGCAPAVLVTGRRRAEQLPSQEQLREWFGLTQRQAEVALLLAGRRLNNEIAEMLYISPHTARRHTEQVLAKLGVGSRTEVRAAILAERDRHEQP